jgi:hypothetical protein
VKPSRALLLALCCQLAAAAQDASGVVMRNVRFRMDEDLALEIKHLDGRLRPARKQPVTAIFDQPDSFTLEIETAEVGITIADLTHLLNTYVFGGEDSPLKNIRVSIEHGKLKQKGTLNKGVDVPFEFVGRLEATPEGKIRIRPTDVKAAGLPVKGLMDVFGVDVAEVISTRHARGVTITKDDIILDPERMLPPPRIRGRVTTVFVEPDRIVQVFGKRKPPDSQRDGNFMTYRGGTLRFGKLTMHRADLTIGDQDPDDPFDFFLARYQQQLVAGYSKTMHDGGLRVFMPDYGDLSAARRSAAARSHPSGNPGARRERPSPARPSGPRSQSSARSSPGRSQ